MSKDYCKYDLARLRTELEQEREIKDMLEESVRDLRCTMRELQDKLNGVDGEDNEWKTRYETQTELNVKLQRQLALVHEKLEDLRGNPVDRLASIRSYDDMPPESLRHRLKLLTDEKSGLQSQLSDCRVGIEQESKLSSTVDAQRRQCSMQPQRATEGKLRAKQPSRKSEADAKKGKAGERDVGGGGGGGGGEKGEVKKSHLGRRLPTLKHHVKH
ncbi:coiled-coil domain-containing protein 169 isoform X2 [Festucalex cinctus]